MLLCLSEVVDEKGDQCLFGGLTLLWGIDGHFFGFGDVYYCFKNEHAELLMIFWVGCIATKGLC